MQFDVEADATGSYATDSNIGKTRVEPAKGGRGFACVTAALTILVAAIAFYAHNAFQGRHGYESFAIDGPTNGQPVYEVPSISFHPERNGNSALTTFDNDFVKESQIDIFNLNSSDPLNDVIDVGISPGMDIASEMSIAKNMKYNDARRLQTCTKTTPEYLYPLPCNEGFEFDCTETPLSSLPLPTDGSPLIIECGTCVYVDTSGGEQLDLPYGLRIEGKLYFPPESSITIRTIYVMVLGILKMDTPLVGNQVKFSLYGEQDMFFYADPEKQDSRTNQCVNGCKIGKKAIAVVGGQLDIQGIAPNCPSWENLFDISTAETEAPSGAPTITSSPTINPNSVCGGNLLTNGDFSDDADPLLPFRLNGGMMDLDIYEDSSNPGNVAAQISNRPNWAFGLAYKFTDEQELCFTSTEQKWQMEMDVRLLDAATNEGLECDPAAGGNGCPSITFRARKTDDEYHWSSLKDEGMEWNKDGWSHFSVVFDTPEAWLSLKWMELWANGGPDNSILVVDNLSLKEFRDPSASPHGDDGGLNNQIHLSPEAADCWTEGSEILITSNTRRSKDYQIAIIQDTDPSAGTLKLTSGIDIVSTLSSDPNHAVEVALLNRRIIFEADDDKDDDLIGGHLIIMLTPTTQQRLEGVEIRNFGQQGNLGRYPVHFHMCDNVHGSTVKKNIVRQSNQRCYVMHGSNGVVIEDNVAFDTFGHCYMTEDGFERENNFVRNLGAHIKNSSRKLDASSGRKESDDLASVFWMTNMENSFEGNVAAGSQTHGYWAETHFHMSGRGGSCYQREDFVPGYANLGLFKDNVAHSFESSGFTSYPPGWLPEDRAVIENFRAYRGDGDGIFIHNTKNLSFIGGYIASTGRVGLVVFGADNIIVDGMELVGNIDGEDVGCRGGRHIAVQLYPHVATTRSLNGVHFGTKLKNVTFRRWFPRDSCIDPLIDILTVQVRSPGWQANQLLENINYDDSNPTFITACSYENTFASDAAIEVSSGTKYGEPGFLVGSNIVPLAAPNSACVDVGGCLHFCPGSCLRTMKFQTSGARDVWGYVMKVSDGTNTITVPRWYDFTDDANLTPNMEPRYSEYSKYSVSLPAGSFTVWFEDESEPGVMVYPKFVNTVFEPEPNCSGFATKDSITILKPPIEDPRCDELIRNGDFTTNIDGWQEWDADSFFSATAGMDGTGALVTDKGNPPTSTTVTQWLDASCLTDGVYVFQAFYRQVDQIDDIENAEDIQNPSKIPHANIIFQKWDESKQTMKSLPMGSLEPIVIPTKAPTPSPTRETPSPTLPSPITSTCNAPNTPYEWVADMQKCPDNDQRLMTSTATYSVEGCHHLCIITAGCNYFSYNSLRDNPYKCILCELNQASELSSSGSSDYRSYRLMPYEWVADQHKCPEGEKRIAKVRRVSTLEDCYNLCATTADCNYFSYDNFNRSNPSTCMLCTLPGDSELQGTEASGYRAYRLTGTATAATTVAADPPTKAPTSTPELYYAGNNGSPAGAFPLGKCEGDCDNNSQCQDGLLCFQRKAYEPVPGCSGEGNHGTDYCYDPNTYLTLVTNDGTPGALGMCEGDCDTDADCRFGLSCLQRNGDEPVPGCAGEGVPTRDYCYDATLPEVTGFQVFSGSFRVTPEQAAAVAARIRFFYFDSYFILDRVSLKKAPWSESEGDVVGDNIFA